MTHANKPRCSAGARANWVMLRERGQGILPQTRGSWQSTGEQLLNFSSSFPSSGAATENRGLFQETASKERASVVRKRLRRDEAPHRWILLRHRVGMLLAGSSKHLFGALSTTSKVPSYGGKRKNRRSRVYQGIKGRSRTRTLTGCAGGGGWGCNLSSRRVLQLKRS